MRSRRGGRGRPTVTTGKAAEAELAKGKWSVVNVYSYCPDLL